MDASNLVPGLGFVNETIFADELVPGEGFLNETYLITGTGAYTQDDQTVAATGTVTALPDLFPEVEEGNDESRVPRKRVLTTPETPPLNIPVDIPAEKVDNDVLSKPAVSAREVTSALRRVAVDTVPVLPPSSRSRPVAPVPKPAAPQPVKEEKVAPPSVPDKFGPKDVEVITGILDRLEREKARRTRKATVLAVVELLLKRME